MVVQRDSINKVAKALCELVIEGGVILPAHIAAAERLYKLVDGGGVYQKKYTDPTERVLHRHLNLYINKEKAAKTDAERLRWQSKILEQREKIRAFNASPDDLDLDGL